MPLPPIEIDHLVVIARDLDTGSRWCRATLGVDPVEGGRHPLMGTHNRLLRLSAPGQPACYLEILAIDPQAAVPARRRWFGLDEPGAAEAWADRPRLWHVVARTPALDAALAAWRDGGLDAGPALAASRETPRGTLEWRIAVRDDGRLAAGGALPTLIQWGAVHPAEALPDVGVRLESLELGEPAGGGVGLAAALAAAGGVSSRGAALSVTVAAGAPALRARLATPSGPVEIASVGVPCP